MRILLLIIGLMSFTSLSQTELEWSFFHPTRSEWIELGVKGSVQEALIANGELPDPFYGTNENKFGWIEEHEWIFKSIIFLEKDDLKNEYLELDFRGIDTYGRVYINDSLVGTTDNAFIPHAFQIKQGLRVGLNEIQVIITPPVLFHIDKKKEIGYELPAPNDIHENAIAPYSRKPQYQFGWDWALRMNTIGFTKPVVLHKYNNNRIVGKYVNILSASEKSAEVEFILKMAVPTNEEYIIESDLFFSKEKAKLNNGILKRKVIIHDPKLWWPRGQGEQYLYEDGWHVYLNKKTLLDFPEFRFGIKTAELVQEKDEWGTSYFFKVNGRRVFAKGADYIPQEIFPARVTDSAVASMVETMAETNFNMVRVWGGGYYPDEVFFKKCDELGIMVWQDFMFACAMYPGDDTFLANIEREFNYQVPRIASHPSVVLFNGNNEVEVAWGNWGFQIKYGLYGKSAKAIEKAYDDIFKFLAPSVVKKYSSIPYVHTSPLSNWGKMDLYNHGSQHYWGVWHGKDPIEDFGKKIGRFNAEYGFQSFPEYNTLSSFSSEDDWDLGSEVMKHHQKSYVGNDMILKHAKRIYGEPRDFEEFVYFSQLTQALAVSMAVAGHRIDAPRCGGTLYWQLNDCWPAPTWSSIDYYGNWKALHYKMQEDYQDFSIVEKFDDLENRTYYVVSDVPEEFNYHVEAKVFKSSGELAATKQFEFTLKGEISHQLDLSDLISDSLSEYLLEFQFKDNEGALCYRQFDHFSETLRKVGEDEVSFEITEFDKDNKTGVLTIDTPGMIRKLWVSSELFGVHFKTNFKTLLPGKTHIHFTYSEPPTKESLRLMWINKK